MSKPQRMLIPLPDFERIFRTIHGVLLNEDGDIFRACTFFNIIGASILKSHYKLNARPVAGFSAYMLNEGTDVLTLAGRENGAFFTDHDAFHCWVNCDGWCFDFMSPLFKEVAAAEGVRKHYARMMFQKPQSQMVENYAALKKKGDYYQEEYTDLTEIVLGNGSSSKARASSM